MTCQLAVCSILFCALLLPGSLAADGPYFANGIKIGDVTQTSAKIWTRLTAIQPWTKAPETGIPMGKNLGKSKVDGNTVAEAIKLWRVPGQEGEVRLTYQRIGQSQSTKSDWTSVDPMADYTHQFKVNRLASGARYKFKVEGRAENGRVTSSISGSFSTAPADDDADAKVSFAVVTGQGFHRRDTDQGHQIYPHLSKLGLQFFAHTGDTVYYDKPAPDARNMDLARVKWQRMYALPNQREFHRNVASYFIKDDHDTLDNDCYPGQRYGDLTWKQGLRIFSEQNPTSDPPYKTVRWGKHLQVWIVEGRNFRSPNPMPDGPEKTIWGKKQLAWFKETVRASDATFKILISPTPVVGPDRGNKKDNHANTAFTYEGNLLRKFMADQKMLSVCGDRHWQYVSVDPKTGLREYSCGPTSNGHAGGFSERNRSDMHQYLKVKGGFLSVTIEPNNGRPRAIFRHHSVKGEVYNEDVQKPL